MVNLAPAPYLTRLTKRRIRPTWRYDAPPPIILHIKATDKAD